MNKNLIKDVDYYTDAAGNFVFTEAYHLAKGYCCGHGCRHCPYAYEAVPEPRKQMLLNKEIHEYREPQ
ncbi:MAG: hypothetical protein KGO00_08595 [Bacteroidetes bacterium]|nr:hypothetical protein [Bacteroidota bacterium]